MKEGFFKKLLDNASDLIWAVDMEGRFIYINDNIQEWGYDKEELVGQPLLSILNTQRIGKRETRRSIMGIHQTYEMEIVDKKGQAHKVVVKSSPLEEDGNIVGVMGIIRDITEMTRLERKLKDEERLASLGRLATGIAHEIRNPLSSVKMNLSILKKRLNPKGVDVEHFEIAQEEVFHLEKIVSELLDYAKPIKLDLQICDLAKVIQSAISTVEPQSRERGVTIKTDFNGHVPMALLDKTKITQALINILLNSTQASPENSEVMVSVETVKFPSSDRARIMIRDHGYGIPEENLKYIFDPFFTTRKDGTGLGLSIVRNIVDNHEGSITIESEPGNGATVIIELPAP
ncbi:MAG: ATP-binding protein [Nitrospinota bacterium]|nr:ATP-binding protein [Nitrospinota bacterium]MDH5679256.1 ATP-binding protein [Nitrospinota bacterium]MDH5756442.1 ATP-binding protein [Nitrospinota bacterium]